MWNTRMPCFPLLFCFVLFVVSGTSLADSGSDFRSAFSSSPLALLSLPSPLPCFLFLPPCLAFSSFPLASFSSTPPPVLCVFPCLDLPPQLGSWMSSSRFWPLCQRCKSLPRTFSQRTSSSGLPSLFSSSSFAVRCVFACHCPF